MAFSERLAQAMCRQLRMVGFAIPIRRTSAPTFPSNCRRTPPSRHRTMRSGPTTFRLHWASFESQPLRVYYVRIERKARPDKILAYFRRQLPSAARHVTEHGVWVDDFSTEKRKGHLRSVQRLHQQTEQGRRHASRPGTTGHRRSVGRRSVATSIGNGNDSATAIPPCCKQITEVRNVADR